MNKKQILREIKTKLNMAGFAHDAMGYVIEFGFTQKSNPNIGLTIRIEVLDKDTFEVLCVMSNPRRKTMDELSTYIFTHKTQYFNIGLSEDLEEVWLVKFMTPDCIEDLEYLIVDTLLEVSPYVIGA